jgi:hypothetical protein
MNRFDSDNDYDPDDQNAGEDDNQFESQSFDSQFDSQSEPLTDPTPQPRKKAERATSPQSSEKPKQLKSAATGKSARVEKGTKAGKGDKAADKGKQAKPEKPKEIPLFQMDRGKWDGGTLAERIQRIRWIGIALWRTAPYWLIAAIVIAIVVPTAIRMNTPAAPAPLIAPFFTREVQYWAPNIKKWAAEYGVDANLIATLMQIESCGLQSANSSVGAQGLFQVMPFHFDDGENMTDPETNARRGVGVIRECLGYANGDAGLAMACYNGGPSLVYRDQSSWPLESQNYYRWGTGLYSDATAGRKVSPALNNWLDSGGVYLCDQASVALGLPTLSPAQITPRPTEAPVIPLPTVAISDPNQSFIGNGTPGQVPPTLALNSPGGLPTFAIDTPTPSNTPPQP